MPYGMHKGEKMANVPAKYLLALNDKNMASPDVKRYIQENKNFLVDEARK